MNTIGDVIRSARVRKKISIEVVEKETKIKKDFIKAIENSDWESLPEYPVVVGFVKNLATFLGIEPKRSTALLRRDYPPKTLSVNPKPDVSKEFIWSPKLTFIVGVIIVVVMILGYLSIQYVKFISPPELSVIIPKENQEVDGNFVNIEGVTDSDATITANNQPIIVNDEGRFSAELEISNQTSEVVIVATSRSGKATQIKRKIVPK